MWRVLRRLTLTHWIFVGMGVGIVVGWIDNLTPDRDFSPVLKPLSTIFLRMIKSIVAPLIFGTLVMGIAGHGDDLKRIGRLALKSLGKERVELSLWDSGVRLYALPYYATTETLNKRPKEVEAFVRAGRDRDRPTS